MPAMLDGGHGTRWAAGTSKLATSANSMSDRDTVALRRQAVNIATASFRCCRPNLWLGGIAPHSAQILVSSSS
jgi:hypothetical protein